MPRRAAALLLLLLLAFAVACSERSGGPSSASAPASEAGPRPEAEVVEAAAPTRRPEERPLPAFEGRTFDGERFSVSDTIGKRLVLFFFDPAAAQAGPVAEALAALAPLRTRHNFALVGVVRGASRERVRAFADAHGLSFPLVDDASGRITRRLGLRVDVALLGVDAEGYLSFGMGSFPEDDPEAARSLVESRLRESLRLPEPASRAADELLPRPAAPAFSGPRPEGGTLSLADLRGRPAVLVFFLSTCPHCHHALGFLQEELPKLPEATRPRLVGVEVSGRGSAIAANLEEAGIAPFDVVVDHGGEISGAYDVFGGVPVVLLLDSEGRIVYRHRAGWFEDRDPALFRMRLAKLAGARVPMLLSPDGYTGNDACGVCHEVEHATWELTRHASAYDTLVAHGSERDGECVGCHVVGFERTGGFSMAKPAPWLEDVGCESCHGRGGPHLSPDVVRGGSYEKACLACHDPKHSLGFEYASFVPRVSHARIAAMTSEERAELVADEGRPREVLPTQAAYVGSEACAGCHAAEYATWSEQPHAHALESLRKAGRADDADCLRCHTTGYGRTGGFPKSAAPAAHPDLARVGCESCHGPGGAHVAEGAARRGTIVALADKCDTCVILQICGSCHDEQNDPGFEFEVVEKIERQRHGTSGESAALLRPEHAIGHAFAALEGGRIREGEPGWTHP